MTSLPPAVGTAMRLLICLLLACAAVPSVAQENPAPASPTVTKAQLEAALASLPEDAADARAAYTDALAQLELASTREASTAEFRRLTEEAPALLTEIRAELDRAAEPASVSDVRDAATEAIENAEEQESAELTAQRSRLEELQGQQATRQTRRPEIAQELAEIRRQLDDGATAAAAAAPAADAPAIDHARRALLESTRFTLQARIAELEAELASYDARRDLLPARIDRATRRVAESEARVEALQGLLAQRRQQEASEAAREAERLRREAARQHPVLQAFAAESQRLADQRASSEGTPQRISLADEQISDAEATLSDIRQQFRRIEQRMESVGLNRATGLLLRRQFQSLPNRAAVRRLGQSTETEIERAQYELIELQDEWARLRDTDRVTEDLLAQIDDEGLDRIEAERAARELASARRELLDELIGDSLEYIDSLFELGSVNARLLDALTAYEQFIRERILWVRSVSATAPPSLRELARGAAWYNDRDAWATTLDRVRSDVRARLPLNLVAALALLALFALSLRAPSWKRAIASRVARFRTDAYGYTLLVLIITALGSLWIPALLWWAGVTIAGPEDQTELGIAIGDGLTRAGGFLFPLLLLRNALKQNGIADSHFRWPPPAAGVVRRELTWFAPIGATCVGLVAAEQARLDDSVSIARLAFTVLMLATGLFAFRVLRPRGVVLGPILGKRPGGWVARMAPALNIVIVGVPAALAVLAWMGYFYTASMFERRLEQTALLAIILIFADAMLDRWLFIARRRVAVEDARRRREQQQAEDARGSTDAPTEPSVPLEEETLDLPQMSEQTRQLFNTAIFVAAVVGVLGIWSDVLPALRILDRVQLYPEVRVVEGDDFVPPPSLASATLAVPDRGRAQPAPTPSSEGGAPQAQTGQAQPQPTMMPGAGDLVPTGAASEPERDPPPDTGDGVITLADVLLGLVIALATLLAFRNFPALLEIAVLQRLPLDSGSRFAITTVLRYAIAIIGIVLALGAVGITWSRVQWLAAALTFGLAFGLQEIFANFVSGLIILAERPFRIGDTVTVGTVSGTVSKIRMRATTITDWDRKELIIPNKNFITGDVINWTLSDTVLRVIVPVGVAYGADVRKAEQTLLRVAAEQPLVLDDPKPYVVFNALGDSTLDFELRAFIPHVDHILTVRHDLHMRIVEAFRQEAIEIAFPQRDLHVRSIGELSKLVERRADVGNSERG